MVLLCQQPTARHSGYDYSYRRMDGGLHINGELLQGDSIPMHLTNGYADNTMANVCPTIHVTVMHELEMACPEKTAGLCHCHTMRDSCVLRQ